MIRPVSLKNKEVIYKVNEIFYSLQGEGTFVGVSAIFVRLAGCSMCCPWCDTKYAQKTNFLISAKEILKKLSSFNCKLVILTGGEPCEQNLQPLLKLLHNKKYKVHLETNGSILIDTKLIDWCTISPKYYVDEKMLKKCNAIKFIVDKSTTYEELKSLQVLLSKKTLQYLQPKDNKKENIKQCLKLIEQHQEFRLSVQLHKLLKIK